MIEKHYAAHLKDMIDTSLVNVRRSRKTNLKELQSISTNCKQLYDVTAEGIYQKWACFAGGHRLIFIGYIRDISHCPDSTFFSQYHQKPLNMAAPMARRKLRLVVSTSSFWITAGKDVAAGAIKL